MNKLQKIIYKNTQAIGMWGYPDPKIFEEIRQKYPQHEIIDLDINYKAKNSGILPNAYCRIIKNIIDNSIALKDNIEIIIASVGEEKCDSARTAAKILEEMNFNIIQTKYNTSYQNNSTPISKSNLQLKEKIVTIMDDFIEKKELSLQEIKPEYGFWGVPPNDFSILELFPNTTHVYGWTRSVEAGRPADLELEMFVDENIPTVFFAQTFCSKMQMAKYLAKKYGGLYVDADDKASNSVKAKIEAFIHLG